MDNKNEMAYQRLNVTIPKTTMSKLKKQAEKQDRSLSNMVRHMIEEYMSK